MTRESILGEVRTVIGELTDRAPEGVNAGARFSELGVDSVAAVELLLDRGGPDPKHGSLLVHL